MLSSLGGLTGIVLTGPRVYYSMAGDGLAFRWLDYVHPVYRTPSRAIVAQGVWASVLAATGAYRELFTRVIYTEWLFFALMAFGVFVLRRRPGYQPAYRTWGYPIVPAVFIVASLIIVINQIVRAPTEAADRPRHRRVGRAGLLFGARVREDETAAPLDSTTSRTRVPQLLAHMALRSPSPPSPPMPRCRSLISTMRIIDFHNHYYPPEYVEALKSPTRSRRSRSPTTPMATRACTIRATTTSSCRGTATSSTASGARRARRRPRSS